MGPPMRFARTKTHAPSRSARFDIGRPDAATVAAVIEARDIRKRFGRVQALRGVSLEAPSGAVLGLLGPNGAGKTTLIRIITAFLPPTSGVVLVNGLDAVGDSLAVRRQIGYLPESTPLYPEMSVEGYLAFRGRLHGMPRPERRRGMDRAVERCWLGEVRRRRIGELSKGYRQRVGLAAALLHDPPVLMLDEPTAGLDPTQIVETRALMRELASDKTMIVSSHILPEVQATCDRVAILARGRVQASGRLDEIVSSAEHSPRYVVETPAPGDAAAAAVRAVPEVERVAIEEADEADWVRLHVEARPQSDDLRQTLGRAVIDAGAELRELRRDAPSLERLFMRLVDAAEPEAPEEAA